MTFKQALKKLGIEDYSERIFNSNSHGELVHLADYFWMAENLKGDITWFRPVFEIVVEFCEKNWSRPESCFQHMPKLIKDTLEIYDSLADDSVERKK